MVVGVPNTALSHYLTDLRTTLVSCKYFTLKILNNTSRALILLSISCPFHSYIDWTHGMSYLLFYIYSVPYIASPIFVNYIEWRCRFSTTTTALPPQFLPGYWI
ncbi:hypothetical protein PISMIDRAFT_497580 [Pisolithus microcarpus 441]|uniref:Unplaced genomic scaffold scaffold_54, whole genome shotgun sequence n=1 Tax=Pisolithus microcarpus 441 TaxID=765257 RepID=A0A0C9Z0H7_9AGAM|nr:hypothetical protein BKA83DRAFT_497580 [Pisolithus microcarpus]KIK22516.1 hypothetical protein PISMIDRAFT_497580 [Pisolithus microcarpus 441]